MSYTAIGRGQQKKEKEKQKVSRYKVSYRGVSQGLQKLYIPGSDGESRNILHVLRTREYHHSQYPFTMTVTLYPDPTQLAHPVREVTGLNYPYGIAINSWGEMIVSERGSHQITTFDIRGQRIRTFGSYDDSPEQMIFPAGIAIDDMNNIYVTSRDKLQKFNSSGELIKCVAQTGSKEGEFNTPRGVALYNKEIYVCDRDNHRIQVFDLDLNFIRSIGSYGKGRGEFAAPFDVKFDTAGHMYVAEFDNYRVQVMDKNGQFIRMFGDYMNDWCRPSGLHVVDKYVYVSNYKGDCIVVYETSGQFVTSFGGSDQERGKFWIPYGITSCGDGYIYVCDYNNSRVQIF